MHVKQGVDLLRDHGKVRLFSSGIGAISPGVIDKVEGEAPSSEEKRVA